MNHGNDESGNDGLTKKPSVSGKTGQAVVVSGIWRLGQIGAGYETLYDEVSKYAHEEVEWDLTGIEGMDSVGALMIWRGWGRKWPVHLNIRDADRTVIEKISRLPQPLMRSSSHDWLQPIVVIGYFIFFFLRESLEFIVFFGQLVQTCAWLVWHPFRFPWKELSVTIYKTGVTALPITALVGCLIGVVLSYLSAQQLQMYGANVYVINLLGIGILREMGPLLAAILVAGRSGSAMTAELGAMQVTQELDALAAMGISVPLRLILPKIMGLALALPLLVVWTNIMALAGGMFIAYEKLGIGFKFFFHRLPEVVPIVNLWLGIGKGVVFGLMIALMATYIGLRIHPDSESLGRGTTRSVVISITLVIILDAVFAVIFSGVGV